MKYPLTFIVNNLPVNVGGRANGPVIRIMEKYKDDVGIYKHELVHVKQWFISSIVFGAVIASFVYFLGLPQDYYVLAGLGLSAHGLLYKFVPWYRLRAEVEAYIEQAEQYPDDRRSLFSGYIATYYNLKYTKEEIEKEMRNDD